MDAIDSIDIAATPERVFRTVLDYPHVHTWYPYMHCELLTPGDIAEGSRIAHTFVSPQVRIPTHFVRTIRRIEPPVRIEETYDEGALVGRGEWTFAALPSGLTRASFACSVWGNDLVTRLGLALTGPLLHKLGYAELLKALKRNCEGL